MKTLPKDTGHNLSGWLLWFCSLWSTSTRFRCIEMDPSLIHGYEPTQKLLRIPFIISQILLWSDHTNLFLINGEQTRHTAFSYANDYVKYCTHVQMRYVRSAQSHAFSNLIQILGYARFLNDLPGRWYSNKVLQKMMIFFSYFCHT